MKRALISDIHANLEALEAVLADISDQGASQIYCLGDIVGYGPNPGECLDLVMKCDVCLLGNHDQAALVPPDGFNSSAEQAISWTRNKLAFEEKQSDPRTKERKKFLNLLLRCHLENDHMFVHGSPRNPLNEYVFPEDVFNAKKLEKIFSLIKRHCFQGHTHVPGVFTESCRFVSPSEISGKFRLGSGKTMTNVGSVGQPRDGDARACYLLVENDEIEFRRVEYPHETTAEKIYAIQELDNFLGDRLRQGQ